MALVESLEPNRFGDTDSSAFARVAAQPVERRISPGAGDKASAQDLLIEKVQGEIEQHRRLIAGQSYLQRGVSLFYHPSEDTFRELIMDEDELKQLYADRKDRQKAPSGQALSTEQIKKIEHHIETDRENLARQIKTSATAAGVIAAAPLFVPGPWGLGLSAALNAANTASPSDSAAEQITDVALGAAKGALINKVASSTILPASYLTRAPLLVVGQTVAQPALNSHTYIDPESGRVNLAHGFKTTWQQTTDLHNIAANAGSLLVGGGAAVGVNLLARGAIKESPLLATLSTAGIYGFSSGALEDVKEHFAHGKPLTPSSLLVRGLEHAAITMATAAPGGLVAAHQAAVKSAENPLLHDRVETIKTGDGERNITIHMPRKSDTVSGVAVQSAVSEKQSAPAVVQSVPGDKPPAPVDRQPGPAGCIVALHGCGQEPGALAGESGLNKIGDDLNLMVVYLKGTPFAKGTILEDRRYPYWGAYPESFINPASKAADMQYISDVLGHLKENYNINPRNVIIGGFSGGAGQAASYVASNPDKVAGLFTVAGGLTRTDTMAKASAKPASVHQELLQDDIVIPERGGRGILPTLSRRESFRKWSDALAMPAGPSKVWRQGDTVGMSKWRPDGTELTQVVARHSGANGSYMDWLLGGHKWTPGASARLRDFAARHVGNVGDAGIRAQPAD